MKVSTTGYKANSKDKNEKQLFIKGADLTMTNVPHKVKAQPVYPNGSYGIPTVMLPGVPHYSFPGAIGVIEEKLPQAQTMGQFNPSYDATKSFAENMELNRRAQVMGWNSVADYEKSGWGENELALKQRALVNNPEAQKFAKPVENKDQLYADKASNAQKAVNQVYYGLSNPLDALGQYSKYGYVPQGNVGNYGFKDDSAGPISLANTTFNPFAWGNAAYRFANEVGDADSWTTGRGAVNMTTDFLEAMPFFSEMTKASQPLLKFTANKELNLLDNVINKSVEDVGSFNSNAPKTNATVELPGLHLKSTMSNGPISKIVEPKTGLINVEQALGIIGKESGGADKIALIKKGLGETIPAKMDYNEFRKVVQDQLIPLERQFATHRSFYGMDKIGYRPINNLSVSESLSNLFKKKDLLENQTLILGNKNQLGRGAAVHGNPDETLGHIHFSRTAESPDVLTVTQIQSDAFQGTFRSMPKTADEVLNNIANFEDKYQQSAALVGRDKKTFTKHFGNQIALEKPVFENFTQKSLLDKNHQERFLQELIGYAGERGDVGKIRLPTSETAAKVQGYQIPKQWNFKLNDGDNVTLLDGSQAKVINSNAGANGSRFALVELPNGETRYIDISPSDFRTKQAPLKSVNDVEVREVNAPYDQRLQTILKKYDEYPKMVNKLFGEEPRLITDGKGNSWYEFSIPKNFMEGKGEIKAFQKGGSLPKAQKGTEPIHVYSKDDPAYKKYLRDKAYYDKQKAIYDDSGERAVYQTYDDFVEETYNNAKAYNTKFDPNVGLTYSNSDGGYAFKKPTPVILEEESNPKAIEPKLLSTQPIDLKPVLQNIPIPQSTKKHPVIKSTGDAALDKLNKELYGPGGDYFANGGELPKVQKGKEWEQLGYENKVYTYKDNPEFFDSHARLSDNPRYNDWIKQTVYSGKWGYNPVTGESVKLNVNQQATVDPITQNLSKDKRTFNEIRKTDKAFDQYLSEAEKESGKAVGRAQSKAMVSNPAFYAPGVAGALAVAPELLGAELFGTGLSVGNIMNPIFFGQGVKNTLDPESDMRKSWSKAYNNPSKSNLIDATLETGLNSLNFLGAGSVGSDLNKMGNFVGRQVNAVRNDIDIIRNAGKYARDMQWQTADDVFNLQGSKQLGSKQLALPGSPNTFKSEIDWSKWNKQIPGNSQLVNEYNTIEQTSKANGTWMKNPDGSAFQGTPEQFVQQNSQNFKNAFGNSQLLNPDGSPMFLYHGSAKKFDVFDPSMFQLGDAGYSGAGIYTTPSKTTANSYALSSAKFHKGDIEPTVYELYGQGNKPIKASDLIKENANRDLFNFHRDANFKGPLSDYESLRNYDVAIADQLPGVENIRPINDAREIVFPTNTQVKSAIGNNGMFDLSNPNIYEHQIRGLVGPNTSTGLTEENVADVINRQKEWLKSEEYVKRRSANTGETPQEVRQAVNKTLRAAENARFNLNSNIKAQGQMTPQTFLQRFPKVEIAKHTYNPMNTLEHEVSHLYSPAVFNISDAALHKGLFDPNVANLSASERGLYANYPRLGTDYDKTAASIDFNAPENYLKTGPEQQVRHLGVRTDILKANNLPIDAQLTEAEIKPFIDSWAQRINKRSKDPQNLDNIKAEMDYDEIWLEEAYKIRENLLKEYGVKSDLDLTPAQTKEYVQRTKEELLKNVTDVLNKAWIAVPAAIGVGAATQQKKKGGNVNKRNNKALDDYFTQAWVSSRKSS